MGVKQSAISTDHFQSLLRNTSYTYEEIVDIYKHFIRDFPNGYISIGEFQRLYRDLFRAGDSSRYAEHVFRASDTNCDGIVDFREFVTSLYIVNRGMLDAKLKLAFTLYDLDGNGYITCDEMIDVLRSIFNALGFIRTREENRRLPRRRAAQLFRLLDKNMDGRISFQEFEVETRIVTRLRNAVKDNPLLFR